MNSEKISLLRVLNKSSNISQRGIAQSLDISLGKVNSLLKNLHSDGFISINNSQNYSNYLLTDKGFDFLNDGIKEYKDIRINLHEGEERASVKEAVILGAGNKKEFDMPASFLELDGTLVIDRQIKILKENGIEKIIIVSGYKEEFYYEYAKKYNNIICVSNKNYKWTGSMASLELAKEHITGDFILIENDLVFESNAIEKLISNKHRDAVLITNESGSGDEAFVEIREGYIYKMSKDIHQFNKIDGEMIGISKISSKLYELMLKEFSTNLNPYMNYEYTMLDVARYYNVGYEKLIDLVWGEIDDKRQYNRIIKNIVPRIKRKELAYKVERVKEILIEGLNIKNEDIELVSPIGGMTNKNYKAIVSGKSYVVRIPGTGTSDMIDRISEGINSKLVSDIDIDADILYYDDKTGIKISAMIKGAETVNSAMASKSYYMDKISDVLKRLHNSNIDMKNEFNVFKNIELYEKLMEKVEGEYFEGYFEIRKDIFELKDILNQKGAHLVPSHNDTVPENFIKSSDGKIYLIDWEYGGLNDPMWDIAAHSLECGFTDEEEELFLNKYFEGNILENDRIRVLIYKITQDFIWSIWTRIKEAQGDDFGSYGIDRFTRAKLLLEKFKNIYKSKEIIYE